MATMPWQLIVLFVQLAKWQLRKKLISEFKLQCNVTKSGVLNVEIVKHKSLLKLLDLTFF
ncbi:hypothetical protein EJD97_016605 [Solanum chilense]|uniref:Uncharacterized protein n=1 Tax=Solanum chilense TaxID=4083 RepID=A0A6N2B9D5_SOLCI|nr:hypothetical protein EJD97_016605 [Solanum chilense]